MHKGTRFYEREGKPEINKGMEGSHINGQEIESPSSHEKGEIRGPDNITTEISEALADWGNELQNTAIIQDRYCEILDIWQGGAMIRQT